MEVLRYNLDFRYKWDEFIDNSKNSSFLFKRAFIEYHSDRFEDYSLIVIDQDEILSVVPANIKNGRLISHQGLSYGGIVFSDCVKMTEIIVFVKEILRFLYNNNIHTFSLKFLPRMYHRRPADELDWLMFKLNAKLIRRDLALAISNKSSIIPYQNRRKRAIKKASKLNISIVEGYDELDLFWNDILIPNLMDKHGVKPVHSLEEIKFLASHFPHNIIQHNIYLNNKIVAGCTMFLNNCIAHAQYISSSHEGRETGCLDYLFDFLISQKYKEFDYFDFGICNENDGQLINLGLLDWKEGFGSRSISHDFYEISTIDFILLNSIEA